MAVNISSGVLSASSNLMSGTTCHVHPVVLLSIVDSYERRNEDCKRVIGTLLGTIDKGIIEVNNCFTIPHNESEEEVAVDIDFAKNMYDLHKKVNSQEVIVGWYSTGFDVSVHSVLIHEYYSRECKNPVHLTVDTSLKVAKMMLKAYVSVPFGVPDKTIGTMFTPIPLILNYNEPEKVGVDFLQMTKEHPKHNLSIVNDLQHVTSTCQRMNIMLSKVIEYVDTILAGKIAADSNVGRMLMDLVNSVANINPEDFQEMVNSNIKDLLMMVYLSNLTKTQLLIGEKLNLL